MQILITLAGHSRRFKAAGYEKPKFLIEIDGIPMVSHVVNMFSDQDTYVFVANNEQLNENPELKPYLKSLAKKTTVIGIEIHELGPMYSILQAKNEINLSQETIVTYCDFFVQWDYEKFKREIFGYDGAAPAFRGLHPASFGDTYYAYMRVNSNSELEELREKMSFTDTRHEEHASTGIYFFKNAQILFKYADELFERKDFSGLMEGYTSLLLNLMVRDGLRVKVTEVEKFICWGTPEDLEQYLFWSDYFHSSFQRNDLVYNEQVNLLPMAGRGSRFRKYGYRASKPLIKIKDRPMLVAACNSFPAANKWLFLLPKDDVEKHPIDKVVTEFTSNYKIIPVDGITSGQAATCLIAKNEISPDKPLFIASCDYESLYSQDEWKKILEDESIDCAVWTYNLNSALIKDPNAFAYCVLKPKTHVVKEIVEKKTISDTPEKDPLVVGSFWFRRGKDFIETAEGAIDKDISVNGEHYVGTSINLMISEGKKVVVFPIEQWISFGDPFELKIFDYWDEFFSRGNEL